MAPQLSIRRVCLLALVVALTMTTGCSGPMDPFRSTPRAQIVAPPTQFDGIPGRQETGAQDVIYDLASSGTEVVAVGSAGPGVEQPILRHSGDGGTTWTLGIIDPTTLVDVPVNRTATPTEVVHGPRGGWLALGSTPGQWVGWSSGDGLTWTRFTIPAEQLDPDRDDVSQLITTPDGFLAVGDTTCHPNEDPHPTSWTSADGRTWARHERSSQGSMADVSVRGSVVVAVGSSPNGLDHDIYRSTDWGQSWSSLNIPRGPGDAEFGRSLRSVTGTPSGFVAVGWFFTEAGWRPELYRSRDGQSWTFDRDASSIGDKVSLLNGIFSAGKDLLGIAKEGSSGQPSLWRLTTSRWQRATVASTDATKEYASAARVTGVAATPGGWLVAITVSNGELDFTQLWRSVDHGKTFTAIMLPPAGTQPAIRPVDVAITDGHPVIAGYSQGSAAIWHPGADGRFTATALPGPRSDQTDGIKGDGAQVLVYGRALTPNSAAITWNGSRSGSPPTRSAQSVFNKVTSYSYSQLHDAVRIDGRWWVVGQRSVNGDIRESGLIASSTDGRSWTAARAQDPQGRPTEINSKVDDLEGAGEVTRAVGDLARVRRGTWVAIGDQSLDGSRTPQPAVWRSSDGARWRIGSLPLGRYEAGVAQDLTVMGGTLVSIGWVRSRGDNRHLPYVWTSTDGGRKWSGKTLGAAGGVARLQTSLVSGKRFVVVGATGEDGETPAAWTSTNGRSWKPTPLTAVPAGLPGDLVTITDAEASPHGVWMLMTRQNRAGLGTVLIEQPVG